MRLTQIFGGLVTLTFLGLSANAGPVPVALDPGTYNFALDGGGGGSQATLGGVPVEIYCDDFDNEIYVPSDNMAYVTQLGNGADLSDTRFGGVTSFETISLTDHTTQGNQDASNLNGANSAERYALVAYLVSLYNVPQGNSAQNNAIQEAIWTLMDPTSEGAVINPSGSNPTSELESAISWYNAETSSNLNSFLSQFDVVSDVNMKSGSGGFQEQIVYTPTPEPSAIIFMLFGLFGVILIGARRKSSVRA
jgi:hypothetical protein